MQNDPVIEFGRRVRSFREKRAITQDELAHLSGIDRSYIGQIERGEKNTTIRNIHKLAHALNINPSEFFS